MCARRVVSIGQSFARSTAAVLLLAGCGADFARARGGLARVIYECEVTGQLGARALAQVQVGKKIPWRRYANSVPCIPSLDELRVYSSSWALAVTDGRPLRPSSSAASSSKPSDHQHFLLRPPGPVRTSLAGCLVRYLIQPINSINRVNGFIKLHADACICVTVCCPRVISWQAVFFPSFTPCKQECTATHTYSDFFLYSF